MLRSWSQSWDIWKGWSQKFWKVKELEILESQRVGNFGKVSVGCFTFDSTTLVKTDNKQFKCFFTSWQNGFAKDKFWCDALIHKLHH